MIRNPLSTKNASTPRYPPRIQRDAAVVQHHREHGRGAQTVERGEVAEPAARSVSTAQPRGDVRRCQSIGATTRRRSRARSPWWPTVAKATVDSVHAAEPQAVGHPRTHSLRHLGARGRVRLGAEHGNRDDDVHRRAADRDTCSSVSRAPFALAVSVAAATQGGLGPAARARACRRPRARRRPPRCRHARERPPPHRGARRPITTSIATASTASIHTVAAAPLARCGQLTSRLASPPTWSQHRIGEQRADERQVGDGPVLDLDLGSARRRRAAGRRAPTAPGSTRCAAAAAVAVDARGAGRLARRVHDRRRSRGRRGRPGGSRRPRGRARAARARTRRSPGRSSSSRAAPRSQDLADDLVEEIADRAAALGPVISNVAIAAAPRITSAYSAVVWPDSVRTARAAGWVRVCMVVLLWLIRCRRSQPSTAGTTVSRPNAGRTRKTRGKRRRTGTVRARASARRRSAVRCSAASRASASTTGAPNRSEARSASQSGTSPGSARPEVVERVGEAAPERAGAADARRARAASVGGAHRAATSTARNGVHPAPTATASRSTVTGSLTRDEVARAHDGVADHGAELEHRDRSAPGTRALIADLHCSGATDASSGRARTPGRWYGRAPVRPPCPMHDRDREHDPPPDAENGRRQHTLVLAPQDATHPQCREHFAPEPDDETDTSGVGRDAARRPTTDRATALKTRYPIGAPPTTTADSRAWAESARASASAPNRSLKRRREPVERVGGASADRRGDSQRTGDGAHGRKRTFVGPGRERVGEPEPERGARSHPAEIVASGPRAAGERRRAPRERSRHPAAPPRPARAHRGARQRTGDRRGRERRAARRARDTSASGTTTGSRLGLTARGSA